MPEESDLSGYQVTFSRNMLGVWCWKATAPNGTELKMLTPLGFATRKVAELDALRAIERHANKGEIIDGAQLRDRVRTTAR